MSEEERFVEKQSKFYGSAKIHLNHLVFYPFGSQLSTELTLNPKNLERLTQIFKLEGCLRLDLEHHVPAIISNEILANSLRHSRVNFEDLRRRGSPPTLEFPEGFTLQCLHGKHRIAAAKNILLPGNKWWTVDLYSDALNDLVARDIRDEYANARNFCDGDIFQQIRQSQLSRNVQAESRWLARLSEGKRKDLKQLQRRPELKPLAEALDNLLPFVGFWPSLQIGTFHRVLNLKCPEELRHYLNHVRDCWDTILDQSESLRAQVDFGTVQLLQMRNPCASHTDKELIIHLMETHRLFPMINDVATRARILEQVQRVSFIIPSLYTFFEDTKWLEPCAKIMRSLLPPGCRDSTKQSFFRRYTGSTVSRIQENSSQFTNKRGSEADNVKLSYVQLWMFAWRHFPELSGIMPRRDAGFPKPQAKSSNLQCLNRFAKLAADLGFESDIISNLRSRNPDLDMALLFMNEARPAEFYPISSDVRNSAAQRICEALNLTWSPSNEYRDPGLQPEVSLDYRCGRPHEQSHNHTKSHFFFPNIYRNHIERLSYLSVNRDIFFAFFGPISEPASLNNEVEQRTDTDRMSDNENEDMAEAPPLPPPENSTPVQTNSSLVPAEAQSASANHTLVVTPHSVPPMAPNVQLTGNETNRIVASSVGGPVIRQEEDGLAVSDSMALVHTSQPTPITQQTRTEQNGTLDPSLYEKWTTMCKTGDLFLIWVSNLRWAWLRGGIMSESDRVTIFAGDPRFKVYNELHKSLKSVVPERLRENRRGPGRDGIIYIFEKDVRLQEGAIIGDETSVRLSNLIDIVLQRIRNPR